MLRDFSDRANRGFTLIELMIVVAIIGILAAIALPAYKDYTIRARLSEAITFISACKTSVTESYQSNGNVWPADTAASGCTNISTPTVVSGMSVTNGAITANIYGTRTGIGVACAITLTPSATGGAWTGSTTCPPQYLPTGYK